MIENKEPSMKVIVLISCMHQKDASIIERTNVQTDVVVVNQCDEDSVSDFDFTNKQGSTCHAKVINTTERGLSRSRNMAISNAWGDVCLLCEDDDWLEDDYEEKIAVSYVKYSEKDAILFIVNRNDIPGGKKYPAEEGKVGFKQILQSSSVQVTFMRQNIARANIQFDVLLGSGSGNGGGEDNKFLLDIRKAKLKIYYLPVCIGTVQAGESRWFKGFTKQYMIDRGWTSRRSLGTIPGFIYISSFALREQPAGGLPQSAHPYFHLP